MYRNKKTGIIGVIITIIVLVVIVIISNIKIEDFSHIGGCIKFFCNASSKWNYLHKE